VTVTALDLHDRSGKQAGTDASGRYELGGLARRAYLVFRSPEHAIRALPVETSPDALAVLDVAMGPGATVRGRVLTEDGTPVAGETIRVSPAGGVLPFDLPWATTDAAGTYEIRRVPAAELLVGFGIHTRSVRASHGEEVTADFTIPTAPA
jgi:hypothetical protein